MARNAFAQCQLVHKPHKADHARITQALVTLPLHYCKVQWSTTFLQSTTLEKYLETVTETASKSSQMPPRF